MSQRMKNRIFEVRGGVILIFGEHTELANGWWFSTNFAPYGPFATDQEALNAAGDASDATAELNIVPSPTPPLPIHDAGYRGAGATTLSPRGARK